MNKNGKLFGKISIIDIIVVVCIVVLAFGLYSHFTSSSDAVTSSSKTKVEFVYKVKSVRDFTVDALKKGGPMYDKETKEYMGEIIGVTADIARMEIGLIDGSYKEVEVPEKYDVYVTVQVDGKANSLGFYTNENRFIGSGSTVVAWSKYALTEGEIVDMKEIN